MNPLIEDLKVASSYFQKVKLPTASELYRKAASEIERLERELAELRSAIQPKRLADTLVSCGIVDPCAIEDPEGYDNHKMLGHIAKASSMLSGETEKK